MTRAFVVFALLALGGCVRSRGAYDEYNLIAHPTMTTDDLASTHELRVQQIIEGAGGGVK